jgi:hypothetical protein
MVNSYVSATACKAGVEAAMAAYRKTAKYGSLETHYNFFQ